MTSKQRESVLDMDAATFRRLGHDLVDRLAEFLDELPQRPAGSIQTVHSVRDALGAPAPLPVQGQPPDALLREAFDLLRDHSVFNGHPGFMGYITSSAAPIGMLGELLAAAMNQNTGGWLLGPMANEIERQTISWIAEMVGFPAECGGLLMSGGNMANLVAFVTARKARTPWDVQRAGLAPEVGRERLVVYASNQTHTWIEKASDLCGIGTDAVRWIDTDEQQRMDCEALERAIDADLAAGLRPLMVVATGGSVSTGAIDPISQLADLCQRRGLWLHVDGAYGAFAACLTDAPPDLVAIKRADSIALDPHKWLYSPIEAGCVLVRDPDVMREAFSYRPPYYGLEVAGDEQPRHFFEYGPQNTRGFRALKVWLALRQAGLDGYRQMIGDDIALAHALYEMAQAEPNVEALTCSLSIATFRFRPHDQSHSPATLDQLNRQIVQRLQEEGQVYPTHAIIAGEPPAYAIRACVVNFRTTTTQLETLVADTVRIGRALLAADGASTA